MNWKINEQGLRVRDQEIEALRDSIAEMATLNGVAAYHTKWATKDDGSFTLVLTIPHIAGETETDLAKVAAHIIAMNLSAALTQAMEKPPKDTVPAERYWAIKRAADNLLDDVRVLLETGDCVTLDKSAEAMDAALVWPTTDDNGGAA